MNTGLARFVRGQAAPTGLNLMAVTRSVGTINGSFRVINGNAKKNPAMHY